MKHWLKLALALALALSMTACGGETNVENPDDGRTPNENVQQDQDMETTDDSETPEEPAEPEIPEEPDDPEVPEVPEGPEEPVEDLPKEDIAFDAYWASDDFEMPFPEPPYSYNLNFRDSAVVITSATSADILAGTVADIKAYCEDLQYFGYNVDVEIEEPEGFSADRPAYHFKAKNSEGKFLELIYDGKGLMMYAEMDYETGKVSDGSSENKPSEPESTAFDTSWASNAYEKLIPQPPFEGWEGSMKDSNVYELFTSNAKACDSLSYYDVFQAYLDSLKALGFSIDGEVYSCNGSDEFGNRFEFKCGDGCAWITIMPVDDLSGNGGEKNPSDETVSSFDTSWASNEFELQIAEPTFESWKVSGFVEGSLWKIFVQDIYYDAVKDYASDLRSFGFILNESENDGFGGLGYIFKADNSNGYHSELIFEAIDRDGRGSFSLEISK